MNVLVIGGRLQGSEIAYLSKEAGWSVTLADRRTNVLAQGLCDTFECADVTQWPASHFDDFDLVIPATENLDTLRAVDALCKQAGVAFAFDETAYRVSASKRASNAFMRQIGVPIPPIFEQAPAWSHGYIVKPDSESGSHGVRRFDRREDAALFLQDNDCYVGQAFVEGPIYSVEVTCNRGDVHAHCVTEVVVGEDYDCFRIVAPADIDLAVRNWIQAMAHRVGLALDMRGIFDVELVWCDGEPFVLEIDARMPSQTPIAVYHATGLNLVEEFARCFVGLPATDTASAVGSTSAGAAVLEHVRIERSVRESLDDNALAKRTAAELVAEGLARYIGESELAKGLPYERANGLLRSDYALLTWDETRENMYATLVYVNQEAAG